MVPHVWKSKQLDLQLIKIGLASCKVLNSRDQHSVISIHSFPGDRAISRSVVYEKELCMLLQMHG